MTTTPEPGDQGSSLELSWSPTWFGLAADDFGDELAEAVQAFQRVAGLVDDGLVDLATFRRLLTARILEGTEPDPGTPDVELGDSILVHGERRPIPWPRVVSPDEPGALVLPSGRGHSRPKSPRSIDRVVVHWDATSSPATTLRVLAAGNVGTHFLIAADGTIWQLADVGVDAWHSGISWLNRASVGVDLSNAVHVDRADALAELEGRRRPVLEGYQVGRWTAPAFLGFHPEQLEALAALLAGLALHLPGLPLVAPAATASSPRRLVKASRKADVVAGVYHHAEVDYPRTIGGKRRRRSGKWDALGVDLVAVCLEAAELAARARRPPRRRRRRRHH